MKKLASVLLLLWSTASATFASSSAFGMYRNVGVMTSKADSIYNVTIEQVTQGTTVRLSAGQWEVGPHGGNMVHWDVKAQIRQTLKGRTLNAIQFPIYTRPYRHPAAGKPIFFDGHLPNVPSFRAGEHCLVFLNRDAHGRLRNPGGRWYNKVVVSDQSWKRVASGPAAHMVKQTLVASLTDKDDFTATDATNGLAELGDRSAVRHLIPLMNSKKPAVAQSATVALVDLDYIPAVKRLVHLIKENKTIRLYESNGVGYSEFRASNSTDHLSRMTDPAAAPYIAKLLGSKDRNTRMMAAFGLMNSACKQTVPILLGMLDSPYEEVRYCGHVGMHKVTKLSEWPSDDRFHERQKSYIAFWKDWARNSQSH